MVARNDATKKEKIFQVSSFIRFSPKRLVFLSHNFLHNVFTYPMKKTALSLLFIAFVALIFSGDVLAQDDKLNQFSFEDVPTEEAKPPYFAISGGFISTWLFTNLSDVNTLASAAVGGGYNSPIVLFGGEVFAAIGIIPNVRVGFMSIGSVNTLQSSGSSPAKQTEYSVSMNGLSIDYAFTPFKGFSLVPGVRGGWGDVNIEVSESASSSQAFPIYPIALAGGNAMRRMRSDMFFVMPNLNIEYAFTLVSMVRLNVGYNLSFMQDWRVDNIANLTGVPNTINATGLTAQIGLFVGLFNN